LLSQPERSAQLSAKAAQTIPLSTDTQLLLPVVNYDTCGGMADPVNSKLIATATGIYVVTANVRWTTSTNAGQRYLSLWRNGNTSDRLAAENQDVRAVSVQVTAIARLCKGDFVWMHLYQDAVSGEQTATDFPSTLSMVMVGPA
jgi:hypothetical protein